MTTLKAQELNNKIVSMRNEIRKSIVHHLHKVTANIKRLRAKKGTEEQKLKNSQKADSLVNEIKIIKKLKLDDVSILALSNSEEDLKKLLAKLIVSPETKAKAKICSRENVQNIVNEFKSNYPNFYEEISKLFEERCDIRKKKKREKMKQKKSKSNKVAEDERFKSLLESNVAQPDDQSVSDDDSVPDLVPISNSGLDNSNSEETDEESSENDESYDTFLNLSKNLNSDLGESDSDNEMQVENNSIASKRRKMNSKHRKTEEDSFSNEEGAMKKISKNKKTLNTELNERSDDETESKRESENNFDSSEDESNVEGSKKESKKDSLKNEKNTVEQPTETNVDPFFMTADNKEYCTFFKVERPNNPNDERESHGENRPGMKYEKEINSGENFGERKPYKDNFDSRRSFGDNRKRFTNDLSRPAKRPNRNFGEKFRYFDKVKSNSPKIQNNDRRNTEGRNTYNYNIKSDSSIKHLNRKSDSKRDISENVKLHPSWEAKKKLSTQSVQFQGKKITFDDD